MKKRYFALILLVCLCLAVFGGCFGAKDKEFSKAGMTITLTTRFTEKELISQTAYYESPNALVTVLKESVSSAPAFKDYTLEEYTQAVLSVNKMGNTKIDKPDGKDYYSFTYEKNGQRNGFLLLRHHVQNCGRVLADTVCLHRRQQGQASGKL